ncbi:MAG TPA: DUF1176 domain-containing protein, partial [Caulobacteraceae bacterium]|nr:DUF1176 domain-containing protein [Caulobacteraceae bacterium]
PGVVLWGPACDMAAYNEIYQFFLGDEHGGHMRQLHLPVPIAPDLQSGGELVNPSFDPKTQTLSAFNKSRGLGDCGTATRWVWDGKAFNLLAASIMGPCRGAAMAEWPTLFVGRRR